MNDDFVPYLCGGILFSLLIELQKDTAENFHNTWGNRNTLTQAQIMEKLLCVINPGYNYKANTLQKNTSLYSTCKDNGHAVVSFENDLTRTEFDKSVQRQYIEILERMTKFTSECFPTRTDAAMHALVKRTLVLIRDDSSIEKDTLFFINEDGSPTSKEDLRKKKDFCFQSFLVGAWHYIITKPTKNENGKETYEKLFSKPSGRTYRLDMSCLAPYENDINVTDRKDSVISSSEINDECKKISAPKETGKEGTPEIKIYYKGSLLEETEEKEILSFSPAIIDLDENSNISIEDNPVSSIYKITTEFQFETHFLSYTEEIIRLTCNIGSSIISGTTSLERWLSRSKLNNMRFRKKGSCTAWFRLKKFNENEYDADFYMIGDILQ